MKIAIIGPQGLPVPAVKGGAIETLINVITKENEKEKKLDIDIYTVFDKDAIEESKKYKYSKYIFLCKSKKYVFIRNKFVSLVRKILKKDFTYTYARQVVKHMKKKNYDKVIIEGDSSLVIPISKIIDKEKIYLHIHHDPKITNHERFRNELLLCNKVIGVSKYVNNALLECAGKNKINVEVLLNCTNTKIFNKELYKEKFIELRERYGIKKSDIVITFVGRPVPQKGVKELLLAFKELIRDYANVKLLIVGNSGFGIKKVTDYDRELLKTSEEIKNKVIFTGFIHNSELPLIHSITDIAVVPSIYNEPAGLVVIEYLASGVPLIVTELGGIPEYINDKCSIKVKYDQNFIENIKNSLEILVNSKEAREAMGEKAYIFAQRFSEEIYYKNYISIISK